MNLDGFLQSNTPLEALQNWPVNRERLQRALGRIIQGVTVRNSPFSIPDGWLPVLMSIILWLQSQLELVASLENAQGVQAEMQEELRAMGFLAEELNAM